MRKAKRIKELKLRLELLQEQFNQLSKFTDKQLDINNTNKEVIYGIGKYVEAMDKVIQREFKVHWNHQTKSYKRNVSNGFKQY